MSGYATAQVNLLIDKRANKTSIEPGEVVTYTIRYRCASLTEHCLNTQIQDVVPADMEIVGFTGMGGNVAASGAAGNTITWDLKSPSEASGVLAAGATGLVTVHARFPACDSGATTANNPYTNMATISASNGNATINASADVDLAADVEICPEPAEVTIGFSKSIAGNSIVMPNGMVPYHFELPTSATSYNIIDNIPSGFVVTNIRARTSSSNLQLEMQCANSGTWYLIQDFSSLNHDVDTPEEIPASAAACLVIPHPQYPDINLFNVSAVRWTVPDNYTGEVFWYALTLFPMDAHPFVGYSHDGRTDEALLPNFEPVVSGTTLQNCITSSDTNMGNSGVACADIEIVGTADNVMPSLEKQIIGIPESNMLNYPSDWSEFAYDSTANPPIIKGANQLTFGLEFLNNRESATFWDNPVIADLLDLNVTFDPAINWFTVVVEDNLSDFYSDDPSANPACWNPTFEAIENYNDTGRTLLKWNFDGCSLPTGSGSDPSKRAQVFIYYSVNIKPGTAATTVIENMHIALTPEGTILEECRDGSGHNATSNTYWPEDTDLHDIDANGNFAELICKGNVVTYTVPTLADLNSSKWVLGELDTEFSRYNITGNTVLAGDGIYEMFIENTGNIAVTQLDVVDMLPHIGDTDILGVIGARGSDWEMELAGDVIVERYNSITDSWDVVPNSDLNVDGVLYANTYNPKRYDSNLGLGEDLSVTGDLPADGTTLATGSGVGNRSFGFCFKPATPFTWNEKLRVTVPIQVQGNPPGCGDTSCSSGTLITDAVAWNSFAFGGTYDDNGTATRLFNSEPIKVGLKMVNPVTQTSLGNRVWYDTDGDGSQDPSEPGIEDVEVSLYAADSITLITQALTDADGFYRFYGLEENTTYVIKLDNSADFNSGALLNTALTKQDDNGTTDMLDSDGALNDDGYPQITTTTGTITGVDDPADPTEYPTNDFGFWQPASIGDYVWYDVDGFGNQNENYPAENVTVLLWSVGSDGTIGGGDDFQVGTSTMTDANGYYEFVDLPSGIYYLYFDYSSLSGTDPNGNAPIATDWSITLADATGDDTNDSDVDGSGFTIATFLAPGEHDPNWDLGLAPTPTPASPVSVGNYVWEDTNGNNTQDNGEPAIVGVKVELLDASGFVIGTAYTDGDGYYQFDNLEDGDTYEIIFYEPTGYAFVAADSGTDDTDDSDADPLTGSTGTFTVSPSDATTASDPDATTTLDPRWDAGMTGSLSLGNLVWNDVNGNSIYDLGESGLAGLTVYLLDGTGSTYLDTTITDNNGKYLFWELMPNNYIVEVEMPGGDYVSSTDIASSNTPDNGTDSDDNGVDLASTTGFVRSNAVTLEFGGGSLGELDHGQPINGVTDPTANHNADYTVDFGFRIPTECQISITVSTIGDCNDAGTDADASDDFFDVMVNAAIVNGGASNQFYVATSTAVWGPFDYETEGTVDGLLADGNDIELIYYDADDSTCQETVNVSQTSCSNFVCPDKCINIGVTKQQYF